MAWITLLSQVNRVCGTGCGMRCAYVSDVGKEERMLPAERLYHAVPAGSARSLQLVLNAALLGLILVVFPVLSCPGITTAGDG